MLKQGMQQRLLQKLSPQQIQLMKLLQVPAASLEQRIKEELEVNPALEEGKEAEEEAAEEEFPDDLAFEEPGENGQEEPADTGPAAASVATTGATSDAVPPAWTLTTWRTDPASVWRITSCSPGVRSATVIGAAPFSTPSTNTFAPAGCDWISS